MNLQKSPKTLNHNPTFLKSPPTEWFISTLQKIQAEFLWFLTSCTSKSDQSRSFRIKVLCVFETMRAIRCVWRNSGWWRSDWQIAAIVSSGSSGVFEERPRLLTHSRDFHSYWSSLVTGAASGSESLIKRRRAAGVGWRGVEKEKE